MSRLPVRCRCALGIPQDQAQLVGVFGAALFTMQRFGTGLMESFRQDDPELLPFVSALAQDGTHRVLRTAVYAVATPCTVPQALLHNLRHKQVRMSAT